MFYRGRIDRDGMHFDFTDAINSASQNELLDSFKASLVSQAALLQNSINEEQARQNHAITQFLKNTILKIQLGIKLQKISVPFE